MYWPTGMLPRAARITNHGGWFVIKRIVLCTCFLFASSAVLYCRARACSSLTKRKRELQVYSLHFFALRSACLVRAICFVLRQYRLPQYPSLSSSSPFSPYPQHSSTLTVEPLCLLRCVLWFTPTPLRCHTGKDKTHRCTFPTLHFCMLAQNYCLLQYRPFPLLNQP